MSKIQNIIYTIEQNKLKSDDNKWLELEQQVKTAKHLAFEQEEHDNNLGQILATVLVNNFRPFLDPEDYNEMRTKLSALGSATDKFQKESLNSDLQDVANRYGILLNIFSFKIVANNAKNPQDAARANCAFDEMMQALNVGDIQTICRIQDENRDLLQKLQNVSAGNGGFFGTGIGIGIGSVNGKTGKNEE